MRFEAFLGLFPPCDVSLFSSRALHGIAPLSFVELRLCFVQCFCMNSGGVLFAARPRFVCLLGLLFAPLPLLVAFAPAFIL